MAGGGGGQRCFESVQPLPTSSLLSASCLDLKMSFLLQLLDAKPLPLLWALALEL